jgi:hypothetical protein
MCLDNVYLHAITSNSGSTKYRCLSKYATRGLNLFQTSSPSFEQHAACLLLADSKGGCPARNPDGYQVMRIPLSWSFRPECFNEFQAKDCRFLYNFIVKTGFYLLQAIDASATRSVQLVPIFITAYWIQLDLVLKAFNVHKQVFLLLQSSMSLVYIVSHRLILNKMLGLTKNESHKDFSRKRSTLTAAIASSN